MAIPRRRPWSNTSGAVRAETVTAIAATVTAVAALSVAVWDNIQTRSYNRVSVQPHLVLEFSKQQAPSLDSGRLVLRNEGIGPALITSVTIQVEDSVGGVQSFESWNEARGAIHTGPLVVSGYSDLTDASAIGIERTIELLNVRAETVEDPVTDPIQSLIDRLSVTVQYTSVWGSPYETRWPGGP